MIILLGIRFCASCVTTLRRKTRASHLHPAAPTHYFLAVVVPSFCPFMALKKNGKEVSNIFALRVSNAKPYEDC